MATESVSLSWSAQYNVSPRVAKNLPGDKILLPPSALEQLLSASTVTVTNTRGPVAAFDPFNPYSLAAARQEQSQWRDTEQRLPHPLTFRLVNPKNGNVVHAGIREFSAEEGEVVLSPFILESLGIKLSTSNGSKIKEELTTTNGTSTPNSSKSKNLPVLEHSNGTGAPGDPIDLESDDESPKKSLIIDLTNDDDDMEIDDEEPPRIIVHAKELPKGTYVRLRPLEAGYNPEDWKSLLERHLRENFTTLSMGEILAVAGGRGVGGTTEEFRFLIDKFIPEGDGICVVDTDLEVDIEALNEEQARETLKQIFAKSQLRPGSVEGSSVGGPLDIWKAVDGQILDGDYVDYQLPSWDRSRGLDISLTSEDDEQLELFVSPFSSKQRAKPRDDEHVFGDFTERPSKRIRLQSTNVELENAEALYVSVHAPASDPPKLHRFSLRAQIIDDADIKANSADVEVSEEQEHGPEDDQCKNCFQWVPKRTMMLHENFCLRNNIACPHCLSVFKKNSPEWANHWHCPHDSSHGNNPQSQIHHDNVFHTSQSCSHCEYTASNLSDLAQHRTSICPGKLILCQFCHLEVPQEGDPFNPSAETLMTGMTAHELADGARTTDCHLCSKIIRLRDMATHLKHHDIERQSRPKPRICRNVNCGRTLDGVGKNGDIGAAARMGQGPGNDLGLCSICFGPLYVNVFDPSGSAMKRRIERRYLSQVIQGCTKPWCQNAYCKSAKKNLGAASKLGEGASIGTKEALPLVKPLMDGYLDHERDMWFCVDEGSQKRRNVAELLADETGMELEWCVAAVEAEGGSLDAARRWLRDWAPGA